MFEKQLIVVATLTNEIKHLHTDDHVSDTDIGSLATGVLAVWHTAHIAVMLGASVAAVDIDWLSVAFPQWVKQFVDQNPDTL